MCGSGAFAKWLAFSDCTEMVSVIQGTHDVANYWHCDVIQQIRDLLLRNWQVSMHYLPRERNKVAYELARYATRVRCSWRVWTLPPASVIALLYQDILS